MAQTKQSRLKRLFDAVQSRAERTHSALGRVRLRFCERADEEHAQSWRQFAHTLHHTGQICFARAAENELADEEMIGIIAHEFGHILADTLGLPAHREGSNREAEDEANWLVRNVFGLPIVYNERTLEEIPIAALRR